jgi:acetyl esterase/lipase
MRTNITANPLAWGLRKAGALSGILMTMIAQAALPSPPSHANASYGPDARQVMDVWLAPMTQPTPCVLYIHGGGWLNNDKSKIELSGAPAVFLQAGVSFVSINYRYLPQTIIDSGSTEGTAPIHPRGDYTAAPVSVPLADIARALQFIRSRAAEWNINPARIAVSGASAGGCSALWLAFHDDLADPNASDPVARQSTKPWCAAVINAQTSLDPAQLRDCMPNNLYGGHAFGYVWDRSDKTAEFRSFLADRASVAPWIAEYSPYALLTRDDPPVYLYYRNGPPARGVAQKDPTHSANHGALLAEKLDQVGVEYEFVHAGSTPPDSRRPWITSSTS